MYRMRSGFARLKAVHLCRILSIHTDTYASAVGEKVEGLTGRTDRVGAGEAVG